MKLVCWIDVIDHYFMYSTLCDDQLVNFLQIEQVVFQILGFFVGNSMLKPICEFELKLNLVSLH